MDVCPADGIQKVRGSNPLGSTRLAFGFFGWLRAGHPDVRQFKDLTIDVMRTYRAEMASRDSHRGLRFRQRRCKTPTPRSGCSLRWADAEGYRSTPGC